MNSRVVVAGNWKMNRGPEETRRFFQAFHPTFDGPAPEILLFPPTLSLQSAVESLPATPPIALGVQNVHWEEAGAFTGEISAPMAREAGATHVLVGHSERRQLFGETEEMVTRRTRAVLEAGLTPVVCVGETLEQRREGRLEEVILRQLYVVLGVFREHEAADVLVAYEPVWAIGTGETATPADAAEAHGILRARLRSILGEERGRAIPILYGGSVKPGTVAELLRAPEVDGVLVGGASLDPDAFSRIVEAGAEAAAA